MILFLFLASLLIALLLWVFGDPLWGMGMLVVLLSGICLYNFRYLYKLRAWVESSAVVPVPQGVGVWGNLFAGLHRRTRLQQEQERRLTEALAGFDRAVHAFPDGIIMFNQHEQITWMNARAAQHFQLDLGLDKGQVLTNLVRHPDFVAYVEKGDFVAPVIFPNPRSAGQTLLVQAVRYAEGESLLLSRDVSDQERLDVMRRDFVANVSHELKTPLTVVVGFVEMLSDPDLQLQLTPEQVHAYIGMIGEQSQRMRVLIEDLLLLSSLESGLSNRHEERIAMQPLLESLRKEGMVLSAGQHEISIVVEGEGVLLGNANELYSAFTNLVANAVRYTPAGGKIDIAWSGSVVRGGVLSVTDTGIGIAAEDIPRLTERFYRVDRGRSRDTGGTGLGLAIVKHILNRHQGSLEVESRLGEGSCFRACFPVGRLCATGQGVVDS